MIEVNIIKKLLNFFTSLYTCEKFYLKVFEHNFKFFSRQNVRISGKVKGQTIQASFQASFYEIFNNIAINNHVSSII